MVHLSVIEARLSQLGVRTSRWFKAEIRELRHILVEHERIVALVCGRYFGGLAILVATDQRILLIDKKTFFMTVEDIRYDMISEIDFNTRMFDSTVRIFTMNKQHQFTTIKHKQQLRALTVYAQQRVMELRHYQQHPPEVPAPGQPPAQPMYVPSTTQPVSRRLALQQETEGLRQSVGSAAVNSYWHNPNPYSKASLVMRRPWSS